MKNIIKQVASAALIAGISSSSFAALVSTVDEVSPGSKLTFAQQSETKKVNITYNVLSTIIGTLAGSAEFRVSQPVSVGITGSYWFSPTTSSDDATKNGYSIYDVSYYTIGAFATFAFNKNVMASGWLVQPTISWGELAWKYNDYHDTGVESNDVGGFQLSLPFIYQWMWDGGFNMRLGIGPSYSLLGGTSNQPDGSVTNGSARGLGLTGMFTIGYAF